MDRITPGKQAEREGKGARGRALGTVNTNGMERGQRSLRGSRECGQMGAGILNICPRGIEGGGGQEVLGSNSQRTAVRMEGQTGLYGGSRTGG